MDYKIVFIFVTALLSNAADVMAKIFTLEVENFAPTTMRMPRSAASGNFTVFLQNGELVNLEICLRVPSYVSIRNVVFSNDGNIDTVRTSIDNKHMGTFQSLFVADGGNGWNDFKSSGPLEGKIMLEIGRHVISLRALTDEWGLEIDNIVLLISDQYLTYGDLMCNLYCFDIRYDDVPRRDSIPSGSFVQKSVSTQCSEQDNVKVEVYHNTATNFDIIANLPKYVSFANNRMPTYDNCVLTSPYWVLYNKTVLPRQPDVIDDAVKLTFSGRHEQTILTFTFSLEKVTPTREIDERLIGTVLYVKLRNMPRENVRVKPVYKKKGIWISLKLEEFTPFATEHTWTLPDRTWDITAGNAIRLIIEPGKQQVVVDTVRLETRASADTTEELYADSKIVFQAVRLGFWHHWIDSPESMTAIVQEHGGTRKHVHKVDSIRIYAKVPWTGGYSQVFVLFQDGRVRLQAVTPHGLDYLPFGSSVNIGQPESTTSHRPYSPIRKITIDPRGQRMVLDYKNGNRATLILETTFSGTKLKIRNCKFNKNRLNTPVLTFMSMWINDGNADTDHVTINGDVSRHISSDWDTLYGTTAVFFRKCISKHNTQAPDISIKILDNSEV